MKNVRILIIRKFYDKKSKKFICEKEFLNGIILERKSFKSFNDFVKYLDGDLSDADLLDYDFKDVDLTKYNLKGAGIRKSLLDEKELHDNFYEENVNIVSNDLLSSLKNSLTAQSVHSASVPWRSL